MLCGSCQDILVAKSEVVLVDDGCKFKHHDNVETFQASAEAGCQLCLMGWYQMPEEVRRAPYEASTLVFYTINEWNRKEGSYELTGHCKTGSSTFHYRVEFVRSEGLQGLSVQCAPSSIG